MFFFTLFLLSLPTVLAGGDGVITWQKDGAEIEDEEKVFWVDETSSKLNIKKATMEDAGSYTCLCDFESGHQDSIAMELYIHGT